MLRMYYIHAISHIEKPSYQYEKLENDRTQPPLLTIEAAKRLFRSSIWWGHLHYKAVCLFLTIHYYKRKHCNSSVSFFGFQWLYFKNGVRSITSLCLAVEAQTEVSSFYFFHFLTSAVFPFLKNKLILLHGDQKEKIFAYKREKMVLVQIAKQNVF